MKSYLSLIPISEKVRKRQNCMTILCIVISVFLVTAVFSMADMAIRMETSNRINTDGNWHIALTDIDPGTAEEISARDDIAAFSRYDSINSSIDRDYFIGGKQTAICGADESIEQIFPGFDEGTYPSDGEAVLTDNVKDILGVDIGDRVSLKMPNGGSQTFVISGFNHETGDARTYDAIILIVNYNTFETIRDRNGETGNLQYYLQFKKHTNLKKAVSEIKEQYRLTDDNISENAYLMAMSGSSENSYILGLYTVAAVLAGLVLLAGVFMIAGSINSNVAQRTGFYGMLRCLGAGKGQIMKLVRLEALSWCKTAIPFGVILGVIVTWLLCAFLRAFVGSEFEALPVWEISPAGVVCGFVIGFVTVCLAASSPARKAAKVSPVAAVSGNADTAASRRFTGTGTARRQKAGTFSCKIENSLGIYHATASGKNLVLMTGSFALSIVLFLCFSVLLGWLNMALNPLKPYAPDLSLAETTGRDALDPAIVSELEENAAVKRAYGRMYEKLPASYQGIDSRIDLISYEDYQFDWAKNDLVDGSIPKDEADGRYDVLTVFDKSNSLAVGDTIQLDGAELTVAGVLDDSPFDSDEFPTIICSEKTFTLLTGKNNYAVIDIQLKDKAVDTDVNAIRSMLEDHMGDTIIFSDRRENNQEIENTYWAFTLFVYAFLVVIALITILNIVNSISLSVSARMKQYGVMRAVGMDIRQMIRMITAEALTYGISGLIVGSLIGLPLYRYLYMLMITHYFGVVWQIPWACLAVITGIIALSVMIAVYSPAKRICSMVITETINEL